VGALAVRAHASHEGLHPVDHAHEVDGDDPVPVVEGALVEWTASPHPRVVAEQVDRAEARLGALRCIGHRGAVGDVERDRQHLRPASLELRCGRRQRRRLDVRHHDPHAFAREHAGQAEADPAGGAGDERRFPSQLAHRSSSPAGGVGRRQAYRLAPTLLPMDALPGPAREVRRR
jgi:hypothetical protein